jgi:tRNA threonylcarbamoyl adenosine modification protein YeaZ
MEKNKEKLILGLETGLDGGSVSLVRNGKTIAFERGTGGVSKSEDLLELIENLLDGNGIGKGEIKKIVVSDGPGSPTGIRIGLALARGLSAALNVEVYYCSILHALAKRADRKGKILTAVRTEKGGVFLRVYRNEKNKLESEGEVVNLKKISGLIEHIRLINPETQMIFPAELAFAVSLESEAKRNDFENRIKAVEGNLAQLIAETFLQQSV